MESKKKKELIDTENRLMVIRSGDGDWWVRWVKGVKRCKLAVIR